MSDEIDLFGVALFVAAIAIVLWFTGCASVPSCQDNPRNMQCMSADQLEKELNQ